MAQTGQEAARIMEQYQQATAINDLTSSLSYTNISKSGRKQHRSLKQHILRNSNQDNTYNFLLEFVAPGDVEGTATLTIQHANKADDQWLYLPVLRTSKRISASKKSDRFMGTEMTYEDLSTYLSEPLEDYTYTITGQESIDNRPATKIEALPNKGVKTQYSKRVLWIDQKTHLMLRTEFYDQKGKLLKVYTATDLRPIAGTSLHRAHQIKLENTQSGNQTIVEYGAFTINQGVEEELFTKSYLETK